MSLSAFCMKAGIIPAILLCTVVSTAQQISLTGKWQFAIDKENKGIEEKWFSKKMQDEILLPGSMAENKKGDDVTLHTKWTASIYDSSFFFRPSLAKYRTADNLKIPFWLTPAKYYVGAAWYQKEIIIPAAWKNKSIRFFFERVHTKSTVWIDGSELGKCNSLSTPHEFSLKNISPGKHTITLRIDNSIKDMNVGPDSHSVADHTQGNWNGIIGKMFAEVLPDVQITNVQIYPDVKNKSAVAKFSFLNSTRTDQKILIQLSAKSFNSSRQHQTNKITKSFLIKANDSSLIEMILPMGNTVLLWDEFDPALYHLSATIRVKNQKQTITQQFAMRKFGIRGTQFTINDRPVFLRGDLNNCEFPLTGYPSMNEKDWLRIFSIAKAHGLNHMRFHSWCPPEAAFIAADKTGFYLQPEAPTWPNHGTSLGDGRFIDQYIYDETNRMQHYYGNYASFCMLAAGNEPAGKNQAAYLTDFINYWKAKDNRRVYTGASVAMSWPLVPANEYMIKSGARGLRWNTTQPEIDSGYYAAIKNFSVPYVTHEMGQWCVYPDFDEIKKYTGVYKAKNFELFRDNLSEHGMLQQAKDFMMASGKLQALCYKAEIEKNFLTNGLAGFQLLGLQDFPGQGTALVGLLDVFWDSKPYFSANEFKRFCNSTIPLIRMKKFVYTNTETLEAGVEIFHAGKTTLTNAIVEWNITDEKNSTLQKGVFSANNFEVGSAQAAGKISFPLNSILKAGQYNLEIKIRNTDYANDWNFWVYPAQNESINSNEIYFCNELDAKAENILQRGGKVYLNAFGKVVKGKEIVMNFTPVFWNTSWFKMRPPHVTGMLLQNNHPVFENFPTSYHTDYQWWSIGQTAQVMHLEDFQKNFTPLAQPIDTWFMNRRLGMLFEANTGNGKIIVCSANLSDTSSYPATRQLFYSIKKYMLSEKFAPKETVELSLIKDLFVSPSKETWDSFTKDSPDELKPIKNKQN